MRLRSNSIIVCLVLALLGIAACGGDEPPPPGPPVPTTPPPPTAAIMNLNQQSSASLQTSLSDLEQYVAMYPASGLGNSLLGGVRIAALLDDNRTTTTAAPAAAGGSGETCTGSTLAQLICRFGVDLQGATIFDIIDGTAPEPTTTSPLPSDSPTTGEILAFVNGEFLAALQASIANWEAVAPDFSEVVPDLLGESVELDYGDAQLLAAAGHALEAAILFQASFDLNADIDELANWETNGQMYPYRLFNGDSPSNIIPGMLSVGLARRGFLNEPMATGSTNTFLPSMNAAATLAGVQNALITGIADFRRGMEYTEDADSSDDLLYVTGDDLCEYQLSLPWIMDLSDAIAGLDPTVAAVVNDTMPQCPVDLPGFTLNAALAFSPATYDGRLFLPNYPDGTTIADEMSFDHIAGSALSQLVAGLAGAPPTGTDALQAWYDLNVAWDELFGEQLEKGY